MDFSKLYCQKHPNDIIINFCNKCKNNKLKYRIMSIITMCKLSWITYSISFNKRNKSKLLKYTNNI